MERKHYINTDSHSPIAQRCRRLFGEQLKQAQQHFDELEKNNIVRRSKSPWASPLVLVKKSDGSLRPCSDYRQVNEVTVPDRYPLPRMEDILFKVGNGKIFSKLDLRKAYHQIRMNEVDIPKTAIITPFGLFEYVYTPFGLKCASQTFQRTVDQILKPFEHCCAAYIDDIIIFSETREQHYKDVANVLEQITSSGLVLNESKSIFIQDSINFLGFNISRRGVKPTKSKQLRTSNCHRKPRN